MTALNKFKKEKNSNSNHGFALKESTMKLKRALYFNASIRKKLKREVDDIVRHLWKHKITE